MMVNNWPLWRQRMSPIFCNANTVMGRRRIGAVYRTMIDSFSLAALPHVDGNYLVAWI